MSRNLFLAAKDTFRASSLCGSPSGAAGAALTPMDENEDAGLAGCFCAAIVELILSNNSSAISLSPDQKFILTF
jgi:hypothetical protein